MSFLLRLWHSIGFGWHRFEVSGLAAIEYRDDAEYLGRCRCGSTRTHSASTWRYIARGEWEELRWRVDFMSLKVGGKHA